MGSSPTFRPMEAPGLMATLDGVVVVQVLAAENCLVVAGKV